jgi:hypothetical protein
MWSSLDFDGTELINQAVELMGPFLPLLYIFAGLAILALVFAIVVGLALRASR